MTGGYIGSYLLSLMGFPRLLLLSFNASEKNRLRFFPNSLISLSVSIYLTDVHSGDGGLLVVPGSHKSLFDRPRHLFQNGLIENRDHIPEGVVNITPKAGDIVVMNEFFYIF